MSKLTKYRPEIDGLRGIAISLVVIFHARFVTKDGFLLEGGMFGVDMFYVISGYLMTAIILNQINRDGHLSYSIFIESRIRRIWPAYFFLLLITLIIFMNGPAETTLGMEQFMQTMFSATIFQSNHFLPYRLIIYGAESSLNMPLLHTWSISVEVQFYILFPILILIIINFFKKNYFYTFFFLAVISIIFAEIMVVRSPVYSFYFLPSRGFELMVGAMIVIIERNKSYNITLQNLERGRGFFRKISNYCSLLGAFLLIFTFLVFDEETRHPSIYTLVPVLGTGLLILFSKDNFMKNFLSNRLFVGMGLISYSLYLFHFPIFSFPRAIQVFDEYNNLMKILLILLSIIIYIFSYFLIEKIFRNKKILKRKTIYILTFLSVSSLLILSTYLQYNYKFKNIPKLITENRNISSWKDTADGLGYCYGRNKIYCAWDWVGSPHKKVYVVGDSHMSTLESGIVDFKKKYTDIPLKLITGRLYLPDFKKINIKTKKEMYFLEPNNKVKRILTIKKEDGTEAGNGVVIYGGYFTHYLNEDVYARNGPSIKSNDAFFQPNSERSLVNDQLERKKLILKGIKKSIEEILDKQHTMILVYPIPEAGSLVATELYNRFKILSYLSRATFEDFILKNKYFISNPYQHYLDRNEEIINLFDSLEHSNLYKVYPAKHFCNNQVKNKCITHNDKEIYYHDRHHLSPEGADIVNKDIIKILKEIYDK